VEVHWVIDHIVPHSLFNYTSASDELFVKCWSLKNLRPLEKTKNRDKWDYISEEWGNVELAKELLNI
jgi:5-methylcytosine-specific restriction endonuclease McrA